ncbi:outer membrane protein [Aliarcobacter thereius]|uniref:Outer membrane protein beta-barrel domain-containing protein n=1 Tax=Aliarcobacter thereius LMG 24486 TaxID=1032240 RepID=A0A1C7WLZ3_9BACT|nr:outer membrane beta-barrel protein [Aliarcobacter thereius]OCL92124.1 hypothetical protein AAX25_00854 [Aliarcobacter thereius]OCL94780.1 hypothetical protein AA347_00219 [Aliarcobacter thereius LMG 24486]QBF15344.1 porin family protein [Aliarcobacter thereius LMG 24486]TLS93161.1 porin family protein [Aliarcobacter thereius]
MKKKIISFICATLLSSSLYADNNVYLGLQYGVDLSHFGIEDHYGDKDNFSDSGDAVKAVLGLDLSDNYYLQVYYERTKFSNEDLKLVTENQVQNEFGLEWIKKDKIANNLYPFVKLGIGIANMKLNNQITANKDISALSLTLGAGIDVKTTDKLTLFVGLDYNYKEWEKFHDALYTYEFETSQNSIKPYIGLNLKF